jgi:hypothetical protein
MYWLQSSESAATAASVSEQRDSTPSRTFTSGLQLPASRANTSDGVSTGCLLATPVHMLSRVKNVTTPHHVTYMLYRTVAGWRACSRARYGEGNALL